MNPRLELLRTRLSPLFPVLTISGLLALLPFPTCLFKLFSGHPCPACGFTRATLRVAHGDLRGSFWFHPLAIPGGVLLVVAVVLAAALPAGHPFWERYTRATMNAAAVGFLGVWAARVAGLLPPV
ncbi:MAG: DUF2752 domain-containing protein [Polyangiales bacterium]